MICEHCNQPSVEISRNEHYVFYKCACHQNKGVEWDWRTLLHEGIEYLMGTSGSIVHGCPNCKRHTYRMQFSDEICLFCATCPIRPLRRDEEEADQKRSLSK